MKRATLVCLTLAAVAAGFWLSQPADAQGGKWGTITGQIVWPDDNLPKQVALDLKDSKDAAQCLTNGKPPLSEEWVVNPKNKGIRWTFVWLASPVKGKTLPINPALKEVKDKEVVMDQPTCMFVPHAIGMREGQTLVAKNSSGIAHNFKWTGNPIEGIGGNVLIPAGGQHPIENLTADRLPIITQCNIHPWMKGWVRVFNHPYYSVTDADGKFEIKDAPTGDFNLMVWHGSAGWRGGAAGKDGTPITIKAGMNKLEPLPFTK